MAFWNKSKYTKPRTDYWFDDPYYKADEAAKGWDNGYSAYGGYTWKPKYDMGSSLESRVTNLIKTITGKTVKLVQAKGWGSDSNNFYYNPKDLENATDDEVLGRILQQLSKDLYQDEAAMTVKHIAEPKYKELLESLEANRSDKQLGERYFGTRYYAQELWGIRKFTDNPMAKAANSETYDQWIKRNGFDAKGGKKGFIAYKGNEELYKASYKLGQKMLPGQTPEVEPNPAWEFCFNIHALQNGEKDFDFSDDKIAEGFTKALPAINAYLNCPTFDEALTHYAEIKKYYPIPNKEQQQQMQNGMGKTQGLSQKEKAAAAEDAKYREDESREGDERDGANFYRDFSQNPHGDFLSKEDERSRAVYERYLSEYQGTANVLHSLITSILKDNAIKRYNRPFKRGKLDAKRMYKYLATDNLRIFKKQREVSKKEYLMSIVVDMSGSMRGQNSAYAAKGAIVMANVLERLGFPYEILAYNHLPYTVKGFNQPLRKDWLPVIEHAQGDNNEKDTIKILSKHIAAYDGTNKYKKSIFWITDGQSNDPGEVKRLTTKLEKEHNATVFAIGIGNVGDRYLKQSYNTTLNVKTISELPRQLIALMKSQFKRN